MTLDQIRAANWSGSIPVVLSLAPTSLSSPTVPAPIHGLLSRHTFLHIGLQEAVLRLHKYAPPTFSFTTRVVEEPDTLGDDSFPENDENDDEDAATPAQHEADTTTKSMTATIKQKTIVYPLCWFEDEETQLPLHWQSFAGILWDSYSSPSTGENGLPWRIRVHFTNYPSSQLLDLDAASSGVLTTVERTFKNSLKQALVLQHGQNKVALNMTKQTHQRIWNAIVTSKYAVYKPIQEDIQADPTTSHIAMIPVRLIVGPSKPVIQKRCDDSTLALGKLLHLWLPQHFQSKKRDGGDDTIRPTMETTTWRVAGLNPPLATPIVDLWQSLSHPDNFLYISILV